MAKKLTNLKAGERVLVKGQTRAKDDGVYTVKRKYKRKATPKVPLVRGLLPKPIIVLELRVEYEIGFCGTREEIDGYMLGLANHAASHGHPTGRIIYPGIPATPEEEITLVQFRNT